MNNVASSITSESVSHRGAAPLVVKSSDGQIRVQTHIKSRRVPQTAVHENTRFQSNNRVSLLAAVSLASLMGATAAHAQQAGSMLPTIDVTGDQGGGYQATQQSINRLQTPLKDTPQTINVVPQQVIQEKRATSMEDALRSVPGITFSAGEGGQQGDSPIIRGFAARGDIFRDGFRDPGWYTRDLFNIDRVEVYKGPSAFAFGRGSTGGAINNVTKLPTGATYVEGTATGTSAGGYRADVDASGKKGNISGRIALLYQDQDTPGRDNVWTKRWGIAPSLTGQLDDSTKATLSYIYQGEEGVPDYGVPYLPQPGYRATTGALVNGGYNGNGSAVTPVPVARSNWYGIASGPLRDVVTTETHILTGTLERELGNNFKLTNGTRYIANDRFSRVTAPRGLANAAGQPFTSILTAGTGGAGVGYPIGSMTIARERRERETDATYLVNQTDLTGKFNTGIVNHTVATGVELSRETRSQTRNDLCVATSAACYTSLTNPGSGGVAATAVTPFPANNTNSTNFAAYVSDQMKITQYFELLGSLRFDRYRTHYVDASAAAGLNDLERTDNMLSYRFGGVYHPTPNSSLYVAYGNSYNPSAELGTLSGTGSNTASVTLAPEKNISYEAGVKVDVLDSKLSLTGAIFRIEKTNLRITNDPSAATALQFLVLDGLARVDGVELGVAGKLTDQWSVMAGYSYLKSAIVTTRDLSQLGRELPNTPKHNITLWTTYDVTREFTVGGGATYQSEAFVNTTNTAYVPDYWKFDAMLSYKVTPKSTIQLNVYNINNANYYAQYYGGHAVPASGRWASLSYRYRW
jgi:catecholate siderophore receptor